jgi:hypothetical protein
MVGNSPVSTIDELPFKIVKMHCAKDEVIAQAAAALDADCAAVKRETPSWEAVP